MSSVAEIRKAIESLTAKQQKSLRDWFAKRDEDAWDRQIEKDAEDGRLDFLFEQAEQDQKAGRLTELSNTLGRQ